MKSIFVKIMAALVLAGFCSGAAFSAQGEIFSRTRHKAAVLALLCYNPVAALEKEFSCCRAQRIRLLNSYIQEGGYIPQRVYLILGVDDPQVNRARLLLQELDGKNPATGTFEALTLVSTIALSYARPSADGLRASMHAGSLAVADAQAPEVARAVYSLLVYTLEGEITDKQDLINIAAENSDNKEVAQKLRGVRLQDWRNLPSEKTLLGRLCRALYVWQRSDNWTQAIAMGQKLLRYSESRQFLAVLAAAYFDLPHLPEKFVWSSLQETEIRDICAELHQLAESGVLAPVDRALVENNNQGQQSSSQEKLNGLPLETSVGQAEELAALAPAMPEPPQAPDAPLTPRAPSALNNAIAPAVAVAPALPAAPAAILTRKAKTYQEIAPLEAAGAFPTD